ncbi:MAG: hypothetical protein ACRDFC_02115, partial [Ignavibacteria bacterium]
MKKFIKHLSIIVTFLSGSVNAFAQPVWVNTYTGLTQSSDDRAFYIAVDDVNGDIYVAGTSGLDYATIKYTNVGNQRWVTRYNGPANSEDLLHAMVIDNEYVYVTGESIASFPNRDYYTIKYTKYRGDVVWAVRYNGTGNGNDIAYDIFVDWSGNVYVTGGSLGVSGYGDYTTIKYDANGNQLWVARYDGGAPGEDFA